MSTENALLTILTEKIKSDRLMLPTLPEIAVRVRQVADDPQVNLNQMAEVINNDPALAARMMKVANSSLVARQVKVDSLHQAVTRIGLRQIKNIATAMAVEQVFVSNNRLVTAYFARVWQKAVEISAVSVVVMQHYLQHNKHSNLNIDTITLAAMVHNIGVLPILTEAERHQEVFGNSAFLAHAIRRLTGRIGSLIMQSWQFPDEFIEVAEKWSDFRFQPAAPSYVDFIRIGALNAGVLKRVADREKVLAIYCDKGILPSTCYLESAEFKQRLAQVKVAFN